MPARLPTNVLRLSGALDKHPERYRDRANEPPPVGEIGDPPPHLLADEVQAWVELTLLAPAGTLCVYDRPFMEYAARVFAQLRRLPVIDTKIATLFEKIIGKLGMSPADRSKVSALKPKEEDDPYGEF